MNEITMVRQLTADPAPPDPATVARAERLIEERIRGRRMRPAGRTRAHRQILAAAGTLAVAAGVLAGVAALHPASQPASRPAKVTLAAWSVTELGHGDVRVTIRNLRDPAGLQARLRAAGVPASVSTTSAPAATCRPIKATLSELGRVFTSPRVPVRGKGLHLQPKVFVIHRPALPRGAGVSIYDSGGKRPGYLYGLVKTSHACTG